MLNTDKLSKYIQGLEKKIDKQDANNVIMKKCKQDNNKEIDDSSIDEDNMIIKNLVLSTEDIDGDGEIIRQDGWKFDRFNKNPVMLGQHKRSDLPVGKWENVRVENKQLLGDAHFAPTDVGETYFKLYKGGFIKGFSVGYRAIKKATMDENSSPYWGPFEYLQQDLIEVSCVSVPCNPNAVSGIKGYLGDETYNKMFDKIMAVDDSNNSIEPIADKIVASVLKGLFVALSDDTCDNSDEKNNTENEKNAKNNLGTNDNNHDKEKLLSFEEFLCEEKVQEYAKGLDGNLTDEQVLENIAIIYTEYEKEYNSTEV